MRMIDENQSQIIARARRLADQADTHFENQDADFTVGDGFKDKLANSIGFGRIDSIATEQGHDARLQRMLGFSSSPFAMCESTFWPITGESKYSKRAGDKMEAHAGKLDAAFGRVVNVLASVIERCGEAKLTHREANILSKVVASYDAAEEIYAVAKDAYQEHRRRDDDTPPPAVPMFVGLPPSGPPSLSAANEVPVDPNRREFPGFGTDFPLELVGASQG